MSKCKLENNYRVFIINLVYRLILKTISSLYKLGDKPVKGDQNRSEMPVESETEGRKLKFLEQLLISRQNHAALNEPTNVCVEEYFE